MNRKHDEKFVWFPLFSRLYAVQSSHGVGVLVNFLINIFFHISGQFPLQLMENIEQFPIKLVKVECCGRLVIFIFQMSDFPFKTHRRATKLNKQRRNVNIYAKRNLILFEIYFYVNLRLSTTELE